MNWTIHLRKTLLDLFLIGVLGGVTVGIVLETITQLNKKLDLLELTYNETQTAQKSLSNTVDTLNNTIQALAVQTNNTKAFAEAWHRRVTLLEEELTLLRTLSTDIPKIKRTKDITERTRLDKKVVQQLDYTQLFGEEQIKLPQQQKY